MALSGILLVSFKDRPISKYFAHEGNPDMCQFPFSPYNMLIRRYRRIMSALDYFNTQVDPFILQKELGLTSAIDSIEILANRINTFCANPSNTDAEQQLSQFQTIVLTALWGNRMDLSIWPIGGSERTSSNSRATEAFSSVLEAGQRMILSNDMDNLIAYVKSLSQQPPPRMDIIVDNAGFELFCDLCLADFLISSGLASVVHIQLKAHPTFVSDAMEKDLRHTIDFLQRNCVDGGVRTAQSELGNRWASHVKEGKWILKEQFFWVQPSPMWKMPTDVYTDISRSALVFVKGDANYRRLLGDLHWDFDAPFQEVVSYFPAPVLALRTLKAELGCGMSREVTERAADEDAKWLVAGKYGVIQFCDTRFL